MSRTQPSRRSERLMGSNSTSTQTTANAKAKAKMDDDTHAQHAPKSKTMKQPRKKSIPTLMEDDFPSLPTKATKDVKETTPPIKPAAAAAAARQAQPNKKYIWTVSDFDNAKWAPPTADIKFNSICDASLESEDLAIMNNKRLTQFVMNLGIDVHGKAVILNYPISPNMSSTAIENALHCHYKTSWDRKGDAPGPYHSTKDANFCFGEIKPAGVRSIFQNPAMKIAQAKLFLDLGAGNGRMAMQVFLEHTNVDVIAVELHPARAWNAYTAALNLCRQNSTLFEVIEFNNDKTRTDQYIVIRSIPFKNTLRFYFGNLFDPKFVPYVQTADYVFAEVSFAHLDHMNVQQRLFTLLMSVKPNCSILTYEDVANAWVVDCKGIKSQFVPKQSLSLIHNGQITQLFAELPNSCVSTPTTWGSYWFPQWCRTNADATSLLKLLAPEYVRASTL